MKNTTSQDSERARQSLLTFRLATVAVILTLVLLLVLADRYPGAEASILGIIDGIKAG